MVKHMQKTGDLRAFLAGLQKQGDLLEIDEPVSLVHEMTEMHRRVLQERGPALLFRRPKTAAGKISPIPVLVNLFGTQERVRKALGCHEKRSPADIGAWLSSLKQPSPVNSLGDMIGRLPVIKTALDMRVRQTGAAPVQEKIIKGAAVDLRQIPAQTFWPGEPGPLITFPVVVTSAPGGADNIGSYNLGIYRMQVLDKNRLIARWLPHRGGARHHRLWKETGKPMPLAAVIGADPSTILAAVTPVPDNVSEYSFAGLLRGGPTGLVRCKTVPLLVPANAEMVIEGFVSATESAPEGPFGDHTGYMNSVEEFPVFTVTAITMRDKPLYLSTYLSRPPDEASTMAETLNEVFLPLLRQQFPEIVDCHLPPESCSYRMAVISIKKSYPGQARRIMMGLWSYLYQFSYTKMIVVVDEDINVRSWEDVIWALSTRMDASRDVCILENTPIDYLDFASPVSGLGGKIGFDATNKIGNETQRQWGQRLNMPDDVKGRVDALWKKINTERKSA
jgi:4-hydroxy-3-polyprenylbenzoate decarboxylase